MRMEKFRVKTSRGQTVEVEIAMPETLQEMSKIYSVQRMIKLAQDEYRKKMIKRVISGRSPRITARLADLSLEQREALKSVGLLTGSKF